MQRSVAHRACFACCPTPATAETWSFIAGVTAGSLSATPLAGCTGLRASQAAPNCPCPSQSPPLKRQQGAPPAAAGRQPPGGLGDSQGWERAEQGPQRQTQVEVGAQELLERDCMFMTVQVSRAAAGKCIAYCCIKQCVMRACTRVCVCVCVQLTFGHL